MNSSIALPTMNILKNCVSKTVRSSNNRILKLKISKSCNEIGKSLDNNSYSTLNPNNFNKNIQKSAKVTNKSSGILKKYSPSVDILDILRKPKIKFQQQQKRGEVPAKKVEENNEIRESSRDLSEDMIRMRLNYDKLNLNPEGSPKLSDELYKQFTSNLKHKKRVSKGKEFNSPEEVDSRVRNMKQRNEYEKNINMVQNRKQLLDMMNTDQVNYQLNLNRLETSESSNRRLTEFDVRDLLSTKEKQKSKLTSELQNKKYFSKKVGNDQRLFGYKMVNKKRKSDGEFEQFKKKLDKKFLRDIVFKEVTKTEENMNGLAVRRAYHSHNKHKSLKSFESNKHTKIPTIHKNYNTEVSLKSFNSNTIKKIPTVYRNNTLRSKSLERFPEHSVKSDFFKKFQLKQVDGSKSDMIKYFMDHRGKVENLTEKLDNYCSFPASVPKLKHENILEPSETVENAFGKDIDTQNAKKILKFGDYNAIGYTNGDPAQYVLCIKD